MQWLSELMQWLREKHLLILGSFLIYRGCSQLFGSAEIALVVGVLTIMVWWKE
jgi:hypothetical protein